MNARVKRCVQFFTFPTITFSFPFIIGWILRTQVMVVLHLPWKTNLMYPLSSQTHSMSLWNMVRWTWFDSCSNMGWNPIRAGVSLFQNSTVTLLPLGTLGALFLGSLQQPYHRK
jgi:hypothetical protein